MGIVGSAVPAGRLGSGSMSGARSKPAATASTVRRVGLIRWPGARSTIVLPETWVDDTRDDHRLRPVRRCEPRRRAGGHAAGAAGTDRRRRAGDPGKAHATVAGVPSPRPAGMTPPDRVVIVGAGLAGGTAAVTLRGEGYRGSIVLIGD